MLQHPPPTQKSFDTPLMSTTESHHRTFYEATVDFTKITIDCEAIKEILLIYTKLKIILSRLRKRILYSVISCFYACMYILSSDPIGDC